MGLGLKGPVKASYNRRSQPSKGRERSDTAGASVQAIPEVESYIIITIMMRHISSRCTCCARHNFAAGSRKFGDFRVDLVQL